jgi:hypothetical protein
MKSLLLGISLLASLAQAQTYTFSGSGKVIVNGTTEETYTTKLTAEVVVPDSIVNFQEEDHFSNGDVYKTDYTMSLDKQGAVTVTRGKDNVGSGYCFKQSHGGKWCDYNVQVQGGEIHYNFYHDAPNQALYRMGHVKFANATGFWTDALKQDNP